MIKLNNEAYQGISQPYRRSWPKYSTQLMNLANQNCKGTNPKNVGSIKEIWTEFRTTNADPTLQNWVDFYNNKMGESVLDQAGKNIHAMINKMGIKTIDQAMCIDYAKEIVYNKTHMGMAGEEMAVMAAAKYYEMPYRFSTPEEESKGIDAWIGDKPVQVKPHDSAFKAHVHNHADKDKTLVVTYADKKSTCYIHNPEFMNAN
jgi:hypothetical protein